MSLFAQTRTSPLDFRYVTQDDADYILSLRTNPSYDAHLSAFTGTVADQRAWIAGYKAREAAGQEFYYVMTRVDSTRYGVVRIYEIAEDRFTWGSWILDQNKPPKAALESALRIYDIEFGTLGCTRSLFDVRRDNARTLAFSPPLRRARNRAGCREYLFQLYKRPVCS